jgi:ubiquinone/menaquinone biosynthesis C-methylase UbiE
MTSIWSRRFFDIAAWYYDLTTARLSEWRADCTNLAADVGTHARVIVDLGTGPGVSAYETAHALTSVVVVGIDVSHLMLRRAERNRRRYPGAQERVDFTQADAAWLPLKSGSIDAITTHSFLYLVSDRETVLSEIRRVLRPGGIAVFLEPRDEASVLPRLGTWMHRPILAWTLLLWRLVSTLEGAFRDGELAALVDRIGMRICEVRISLSGYGWRVVAKVPDAVSGLWTGQRCEIPTVTRTVAP